MPDNHDFMITFKTKALVEEESYLLTSVSDYSWTTNFIYTDIDDENDDENDDNWNYNNDD